MIKVKIKFSNAIVPKREDLLNEINPFHGKCSKLQKFRKFFIMWCDSDKDVDNLISAPCLEALNSLSCVPQLPPEIRARRTVLLRYVHEQLQQNDDLTIIEELQRENHWFTVTNIYKFSTSSTIKVTCATIAMASRTKDSRVVLFNFFVPQYNISMNQYINIIMCYKFYCLDDHYASNCPKTSDYKVSCICGK